MPKDCEEKKKSHLISQLIWYPVSWSMYVLCILHSTHYSIHTLLLFAFFTQKYHVQLFLLVNTQVSFIFISFLKHIYFIFGHVRVLFQRSGSLVVARGFSSPAAYGLEPTFPALEGVFPTTGPPGKSPQVNFKWLKSVCCTSWMHHESLSKSFLEHAVISFLY